MFKQKIRKGRGKGSGYGKTAGKGHKGQWGRGRLTKVGFEGGQSSFSRIYPKRGFFDKFAKPLEIVDLRTVQLWILKGRIRSDQIITMKTLLESRLVRRIQHGVKLVAEVLRPPRSHA